MAYITHIHVENCRNVKSLDVNLSRNDQDETAQLRMHFNRRAPARKEIRDLFEQSP